MDRNYIIKITVTAPRRSLSARRAWIEISTVIVILRKRNTSLSARRAWIEICLWGLMGGLSYVALRKESVDRNLLFLLVAGFLIMSLSARRAWIEIR